MNPSSGVALLPRWHRLFLTACVVVGFLARLAVRVNSGGADYRTGAYDFYLRIAQTWVEGFGLCVEPGYQCALRMPLYPLLLSPFVAADAVYPWLVVLQSALGAALVLVLWDLARQLFGQRAALLAAAAAAINPYAVVHDTALQDTVVVNVLVAFGVLLLVRAVRAPRESVAEAGYWLGGAVLGLAVMTTARVALLLPAAGLWVLLALWRRPADAVRAAVLFALPVVLLLGGWTLRNWTTVGAPVLTTESGESFWLANNAWTFEYLPSRSIDLAGTQSHASLSAGVQAELTALGGNDVAVDRYLGRLGWDWLQAHPLLGAERALRKMWMAVDGRISPARSAADSFGYAAFFMPVHLLAAIGMMASWRRGHAHRLVPFVIGGFLITTAVYWAHTSHKSVIDAFLLVYAAGTLSAVWDRQRGTEAGGRGWRLEARE